MDMIQSYRVDPDRAQALKEKSFEISMQAKEHIKEPDLIRFLIDSCLDAIETHNGGFLTLDIPALQRTLEEEKYNHKG